MPRKGENIYQRKDGRWEARIPVECDPKNGKKYHSVYGKTYREVKEKKQRLLFLLDSEAPPASFPASTLTKKPFVPDTLSFGECAAEWLSQQKRSVKPSTYTTYLRLLTAQILPNLEPLPLNTLSEEHIQNFLQEKAINGRLDGQGGLSQKSVSDIRVLLNSIFSFAAEKYRYQNPLNLSQRGQREKNSITPLSEEECHQLTQYLFTQTEPEAAGILISLYSGFRLGEICALQWKNIDLQHGVFKIRQTLSRVLTESLPAKPVPPGQDFFPSGETSHTSQGLPPAKQALTVPGQYSQKTRLVLSSPKTACSIRDIPIPQLLLPLLEKLEKQLPAEHDNYFFLSGQYNFVDPRTFQNHFKKYLADCHMRSIPYHCLRHTFATNCVILDFDIKTLSEILGHANTAITMERYVHSSLHRKQLQMQKFSKVLFTDSQNDSQHGILHDIPYNIQDTRF